MRRLIIALLLVAAVPARASTVELYTMGPGDDLFSAFGHAAICVHDARSPEGRCYNYGTADFRTPLPLTWNFIRGRALFWVSVIDLPRLLEFYQQEGRSVWRQTLTLPPVESDALAVALEASTDERVKYYRYHHFDDNCTTRIRDLLDRATGGKLRRDPVSRGRSFREWARDGFAGSWPMLVVTELLLGRSADRVTDSWSAMFLPSEMRAEVAQRLGVQPVQVVRGRFGPPAGSPALGSIALALIGALLALSIVAGARLGRRSLTTALSITGALLGLLALLLDLLALLSTFPELTRNESLLIFWPTDFALPFLSRDHLRPYTTLRLAAIALIALAHLFALRQPLAPLFLAALPLLAARLANARLAKGRS